MTTSADLKMSLGMSIAEARLILHHNPISEIHNAQAIKASPLPRSASVGTFTIISVYQTLNHASALTEPSCDPMCTIPPQATQKLLGQLF